MIEAKGENEIRNNPLILSQSKTSLLAPPSQTGRRGSHLFAAALSSVVIVTVLKLSTDPLRGMLGMSKSVNRYPAPVTAAMSSAVSHAQKLQLTDNPYSMLVQSNSVVRQPVSLISHSLTVRDGSIMG